MRAKTNFVSKYSINFKVTRLGDGKSGLTHTNQKGPLRPQVNTKQRKLNCRVAEIFYTLGWRENLKSLIKLILLIIPVFPFKDAENHLILNFIGCSFNFALFALAELI